MTRPTRENLFRPEPVETGQQPASYALFDMPDANTPARLDDFDPATDALHLQLLDAALFGLAPDDWPQATLTHDPATDTTAVAVNGVIVARLAGDPGLDPADIVVTALA